MNTLKPTTKEKAELLEWLGEEEYKEFEKRRIEINKARGYDTNSTTSS